MSGADRQDESDGRPAEDPHLLAGTGDATEGDEGGGAAGASVTAPPQPAAVRAALAGLPVEGPGDRFWEELERSLGDESPLQITPRPAIRPITQPPPREGSGGSDEDVFERGGQRREPLLRRLTGRAPTGGGPAGRGRAGGWRPVLALLAAGAVVLVGVGLLWGDPDETGDTETGGATTGEAGGRAPGDEETPAEGEGQGAGQGEGQGEGGEATTTVPPTTEPVAQGLGPDVPLTAAGLGPLRTGGIVLGDVAAAVGVEPEVDGSTFTGSGGRCFEATLPGAPDLTLWVRSGSDAPGGVEDPAAGVLSALSITAHPGSDRVTDTGIGLGAPEAALADAHPGGLRQEPNPYHADGRIYLAEAGDGSGNSVAYVVANQEVIEIRVGATTVVSRPHPCL